MRFVVWIQIASVLTLCTVLARESVCQPAGGQQARVVSPEVSADRHLTFRILAPKAEAVRLNAGDIPGVGGGKDLTKGDNGVWEITLGPVDPGAYRYTF